MRKVSTLWRRGRRLRTATALAMTGALAASAGVVMLGAATATAESTVHKSYVCKWIGEPGTATERLQTGDNPIHVDNNAIGGYDGSSVEVGDVFSDRQGFSVVIVANTPKLDSEPDIAACFKAISVPAMPRVDDPCNEPGVTRNNAFVVPEDTYQLDWTLLENGDVKVEPKFGYRFPGLDQVVTFQLPADNGQLCDVPDREIPVPAQPGTSDPCNEPGVTSNIAFVVPADTDQLDWTLLGNGDVTVAPKPGFRFEGDSQLVTFELPADRGDLCDVAGVEEVAPVVTFEDPTCAKLDRFTWKGNLESIVDYSMSGTPGFGATVTVTATVKPAMADRYAFVEGFDNTFTHRYPSLAELDCVKGTQTTAPKPDQKPTVLGTQAAVPSAVAAGIGGADQGAGLQPLGQLMATGGLLLLAAAGWVAFGRRSGEHRI